jgi:hypothetical protein
MLRPMRCTLVRALASLVIATPTLLAQDSTSRVRRLRFGTTAIAVVAGDVDDRQRLRQITGHATTAGALIRSTTTVSNATEDRTIAGRRWNVCAASINAILPQFDLTWNSAIPVERNDGGVWAGRGVTLHGLTGVAGECGPVRVRFAPEIWYAQNTAFGMIGLTLPGRSGFTNPFFSGAGWSADLPIRFGSEPLAVFEPGQSSIEVDLQAAVVGFATESQWWGPALRNALVMSNHAAGFPHAFIRTGAPVRSLLGLLEAKWIVGALSESRFHDFDERNDMRSLSGLVATVRIPADTDLTIGWARVVVAPVGSAGALPARFLDAVGRWGEGLDVRAATQGRAADQISELFARWVFPRSGFEAYAEWARVILPTSLRELILTPHRSQGYTLGFQWISDSAADPGGWRVQGEVTNLEQQLDSRAAAPPTFYVSPSVGQGYTQRGQVIGAMIGPGSQSQFLAVDRLRHSTTLGAFLGRTRWANDAFFKAPTGLSAWAHDVSLFAGVRGGRRNRRGHVRAELIAEQRLNYLFQSATIGFAPDRTFDVRNISLRIAIEPSRTSR